MEHQIVPIRVGVFPPSRRHSFTAEHAESAECLAENKRKPPGRLGSAFLAASGVSSWQTVFYLLEAAARDQVRVLIRRQAANTEQALCSRGQRSTAEPAENAEWQKQEKLPLTRFGSASSASSAVSSWR